MKTDDPEQYFFNQESKLGNPGVSGQQILSDGFNEAGVVGSVKIVLIPMAKNKILYRLENLHDIETFEVYSSKVAAALWTSANPTLEMPDYKLTETSVTGNMPVEEMQARRLKWKTNVPFTSKISWDQGEMVKLEPQRIRTYILEF
jgi:hypothetical protein